MASGTLGQSALSAATNTTVYTVPSQKLAAISINVVNRGNIACKVRLAIAATGTPANQEYLEYDVTIAPNGVLERTGIVASASKNVVAYCDNANVSVNVYGYEENA